MLIYTVKTDFDKSAAAENDDRETNALNGCTHPAIYRT